jgi:hypothetical protein
LVFVAEKSAKTIQFCFKKGKHQTYITPKKDWLVSCDLQAPISFDYPIANLKTFLADDIKDLDPDKNNVDISQLVLATDKDELGFNTKIILVWGCDEIGITWSKDATAEAQNIPLVFIGIQVLRILFNS